MQLLQRWLRSSTGPRKTRIVLQDELVCRCEDLATASKEFLNCWATRDAASAKLSTAISPLTRACRPAQQLAHHLISSQICGGRWLCLRFAASRTVRIPKSSAVDGNGLIVRSPGALRPLSVIARSSTQRFDLAYMSTPMRCIHAAQRCVSTRQMTDNIFEVETTALLHFACATRDSSTLLHDFAFAYPCVNHTWIFHVLEQT